MGFLPDSQADIDLETSVGFSREAFKSKSAIGTPRVCLVDRRFTPRISTTGTTMMAFAS
jgi:hypothetical protein